MCHTYLSRPVYRDLSRSCFLSKLDSGYPSPTYQSVLNTPLLPPPSSPLKSNESGSTIDFLGVRVPRRRYRGTRGRGV